MAGGPRVGGEQWTVTKIFYWASPPIGAHSRPFSAHDCPSQCSFGRLAENVLDKVAGKVCVSFEWCSSYEWTVANQALTIRKVQKVVQKWFPNLWAVERAPQPVGGLGRRRFKPAEGRTTKNTNHTNRDQAGKFPGVRTEAKEEHEEREPLM